MVQLIEPVQLINCIWPVKFGPRIAVIDAPATRRVPRISGHKTTAGNQVSRPAQRGPHAAHSGAWAMFFANNYL